MATQATHCLLASQSAAGNSSSTSGGDDPGQAELLARLGKHKMGKSCLYFKRLADLDVKVLEALIAGSVAEVRRRYPHSGDV